MTCLLLGYSFGLLSGNKFLQKKSVWPLLSSRLAIWCFFTERVCNCQRIDFFPNLSTQLVHRQWPGLCFGPSPFKIELLGASGFPTWCAVDARSTPTLSGRLHYVSLPWSCQAKGKTGSSIIRPCRREPHSHPPPDHLPHDPHPHHHHHPLKTLGSWIYIYIYTTALFRRVSPHATFFIAHRSNNEAMVEDEVLWEHLKPKAAITLPSNIAMEKLEELMHVSYFKKNLDVQPCKKQTKSLSDRSPATNQ